MRLDQRLVISLLICTATTSAQQADERKPTETTEKAALAGTITGHVFLGDTKSPARKASVYLEPLASLQADAPPDPRSDRTVTAKVDALFDGSYTFTHVAPGSYYVVATSPGYVSPFFTLSRAEARSASSVWAPLGPQQKDARDRILQSLPRVDVQSNQPASAADVVLERGAGISGNITYDDGGPAAGLQVQVLARLLQDGKETWAPLPFKHFGEQILTDDRGNFRISGLPAGKYAIEVALEVTNSKTYFFSSGASSTSYSPVTLEIYSGNTPHVKDAAGFRLQPREERTGEDIVIPISKLHTIRGNIVSARDGHVVNSGGVSLQNADDRSFVGNPSLMEDETGFTLSFIFEGDYILSCSGAADVDYIPIPEREGNFGPPQFSTRTLHQYGPASMPLHVTSDMDGVIIAVPEPTAKEAQMYKDAIRQQENQENQTPPQ
jgi:hypothetical protein